MSLAGPLAEARQLTLLEVGPTGTAKHDMARFEETAQGQTDIREATKLARALSFTADEARHLTHQLAWRTAGRFVARAPVWNAVETLAAALVDYRELEGCLVHWVIRRALDGSYYGQLGEELQRKVEGGYSLHPPLSEKAKRLGR
jgi:hypothetical protein